MHPFRPASTMNANRFDEGYSEDTRSQNETDMVMGAGDSGMEAEAQQFSLPDWIMGLDEQQRSGGSSLSAQPEQATNVAHRDCLRYSTIVTDLIDSWDR